MSPLFPGPDQAAVIARTYYGAERLAVEQALRDVQLSRSAPGRRLARRVLAVIAGGARRPPAAARG